MDNKITFAELIDKIAVETGASKQFIHDFLSEITTQAGEGLERDGHVSINGLGRFRLKWYEARSGINPQTGEEMEIPAQSRVLFTPEKELREYINRKYASLEPEVLPEEPGKKTAEKSAPPEKPGPLPEPAPVPELEEPESPPELKEPEKPAVPIPPPTQAEAPPLQPPERRQEPATAKRRSLWWVWLLVILLIVILAYLFWPAGEKQAVRQPMASEQPADPAPQKPAPAPAPAPEQAAAPAPGTPGGTHLVQNGDNLWGISDDFYGSPYLWPNIFRVNTGAVNNPDRLVIGKEIKIPALQGKPGNLTAGDHRDIAAGFAEAYLAYKSLGQDKAIYYLWVARQWNDGKVIDRYRDRIQPADLEEVKMISGEPLLP